MRITDPHGLNQEPLFRPYHLGEKFPTLDFLVELVGLPAGTVAYFFAQVKATNQGLTKNPPVRLRIGVSQDDIDRMLIYPGPTYVVGVDSQTERAYIASVNGTAMKRIQGLPAAHPLDAANMRTLWQEVEGYWMGKDMILNNSHFKI